VKITNVTVGIVAAVVCFTSALVAFLVWEGQDVTSFVGFVLAVIPATITSLVTLQKLNKVEGTVQNVSDNVNGHLHDLAAAAGIPTVQKEGESQNGG